MNPDLLKVLKQIIADRGEAILSEPKVVNSFLLDLAKDVPKFQKNALIKCLEHGFVQILQNANKADRLNNKKKLAERLHNEEGLDITLCENSVGVLATALYAEEEPAPASEPPKPKATSETAKPGGFSFDDIFKEFGDIFQDIGGLKKGESPDDLQIGIALTQKEVAEGTVKKVNVKRLKTCPDCNGKGGTGTIKTCSTCNGNGKVRRRMQSIFGEMVNVTTCPDCGGSGEMPANKCKTCSGQRRVKIEDTIAVKIPSGVKFGNYIKLQGEGNASLQGGSPGSLIVHIEEKEDKFIERNGHIFERDGQDLFYKVAVPVDCLTSGGTQIVPTLNGEVKVKINAGLEPGTKLRLKGCGLPSDNSDTKGDLYVEIVAQNPENANLANSSFESGKDNYEKGNYNAAIANFTKAMELREKADPEDYHFRGRAYYDKGDCDAAIADFTKAIELKNDATLEAHYYYRRGKAYYDKDNYDTAIADLTKAIELRKKGMPFYNYWRGQAYLKKGDNDAARKDFEKTLEIDPKYEKAQEALNSLPKSKSGILSLFTKR